MAAKPVEFYSRPFSEVTLRPEQLEKFNHLGRTPKIVFISNMADLFHEEVPFEYIDEVFSRMANQKRHTYLVLTKRAARMKEFVEWHMNKWEATPDDFTDVFSNVYMGVTCENQARADERLPFLEAMVKEGLIRHDRSWASWEPLLGPVKPAWLPALNICGGESGRKARPMNCSWVYDIKNQCDAAGIRFHFKQWSNGSPICYCPEYSPATRKCGHSNDCRKCQVLDGIDYSLLKPADIWKVA